MYYFESIVLSCQGNQKRFQAVLAYLAKVFFQDWVFLIEYFKFIAFEFRTSVAVFKPAIMGATAEIAFAIDTVSVRRAASPTINRGWLDFFALLQRKFRRQFAFFRIIAGGGGNKNSAIQT